MSLKDDFEYLADEKHPTQVWRASERIRMRMETAEAILHRFRELEWARSDWQGFCPFRQHPDVRCTGTDGQRSAFGSATPRPHVEACPYHHLNQMVKP